jgi:hypothetical protein
MSGNGQHTQTNGGSVSRSYDLIKWFVAISYMLWSIQIVQQHGLSNSNAGLKTFDVPMYRAAHACLVWHPGCGDICQPLI